MNVFGVQVIGCDSVITNKPKEVDGLLQHCIRWLRKHPLYKSSLVEVLLESNSHHIETRRYAALIDKPKYQPVRIESKDTRPDHRPGIRTGKAEKFAYVGPMRRALVEGTIHIAREEDFKPYFKKPVGNEKTKLEILFEHLGQMRYVVKPPTDPTGESTIIVTGKGSGPDDLAIALMIGIYWGWVLRADESFVRMVTAHLGRSLS